MPQPVPELQEILALEYKLRADMHDIYPNNSVYPFNMDSKVGATMEASLPKDVIYIKK